MTSITIIAASLFCLAAVAIAATVPFAIATEYGAKRERHRLATLSRTNPLALQLELLQVKEEQAREVVRNATEEVNNLRSKLRKVGGGGVGAKPR